MAHHAYVAVGTSGEVESKTRSYAARLLSLTGSSNPDIQTLSFGVLSVDDVRVIASRVYQSSTSGQKIVSIYASRIFHESQNALLKICEEPPEGVTIIIGVSSLGQLLPTLRSRLLPLPEEIALAETNAALETENSASVLLLLSKAEQEKYIGKLLDRSKSDKDEVKQAARTEATKLLKSLLEVTHAQFLHEETLAHRAELHAFLEDLSSFVPLVYERSTPLKLIFEHILLVIPKSLRIAKV